MPLTRPKIWDLDTSIEYFTDPITVLHQGATSPNVDVGFLFNRANGLTSNVALYWSESAQSIVTAYTNDSGNSNANISLSSYANLTVGSILLVNGTIYANGAPGISGQFLQSTGTGLQWSSASFSGGTVANYTNFLSNVQFNSNLTIGISKTFYDSQTISNISTGDMIIDSFATTDYRSAKYVISVTDNINNQYQTSEIVLVHDGINSTISSYGLVYTGSAPVVTFSSNISTNQVNLYAQGTSTQNTVKIVRTLIPV